VIHDNVETPHVASLPTPRKFGPLQPGTLSKIIQAYKAAVTRQARRDGHIDFTWQERFYDHIIRDDKSLKNIRAYIMGNPVKWDEDEYFLGIWSASAADAWSADLPRRTSGCRVWSAGRWRLRGKA